MASVDGRTMLKTTRFWKIRTLAVTPQNHQHTDSPESPEWVNLFAPPAEAMRGRHAGWLSGKAHLARYYPGPSQDATDARTHRRTDLHTLARQHSPLAARWRLMPSLALLTCLSA